MDNLQEQLNNILGYGEKIQILIGIDKNGTEIFETFHFTPVSMKDLPGALSKFKSFIEIAPDGLDWNEDVIQKAAELLLVSLQKMHPNVTTDEIKEKFSLAVLLKGIRIVMDLNDFLFQVRELNKNISTMPVK